MASTHLTKRNWTRWRRSNFDFFQKELAAFSPDCVLVDLGAGPEQFREVTWRFKKISVDFKQYGTTDIVSDLNTPIPLPSGSADIVFLSNVLEHLPNTASVLAECSRLLKNEGYLIGTIPFLAAIHQEPYDFHRYTSFMLERLLKEASFQNIEITTLGMPHQLYRNMQDVFFRHAPKTFFMKLYQLIERSLYAFFRLFAVTSPTPIFCQGYGFKARK